MELKQNRTIIITGATGLIGSKLAARLTDRGERVIAFVRHPERDKQRVPKASHYVKWEAGMHEGEWKEAIDDADALINLAGAPIAARWTDEHKQKVYNSRVLGTRHLVEAVMEAERGPSVLVNGSAVGYYGASALNHVDEASPPGDDFMGRVCADWEAEAVKAAREGVRVALIRTGIVLSPDGGALEKIVPPFRLFVGGPFGSGNQPWPWIHIDDLINLFLFALDNEKVEGPLIGAAPDDVTNKEFSKALGRVLGRPSFFHVPEFVLRLVLGEGAVTVLNGQRVIPRKTIESGFEFTWSGVEEALSDLLDKKKIVDR